LYRQMNPATAHNERVLKSEMNSRRKLVIGLAASALASPWTVFAQPQSRVWRIGYLATSDPATSPQLEALRNGLRERGYVEGKNLQIEYRWAEGSIERRPELVADLVRLKVEIILAFGTPAVLAAKQATATIPIVMVGVGDPVHSGLVASLARPGANITGVSNFAAELTAKLVELLQQVVPGITRLAVLRNPSNAVAARQMQYAQTAAQSLGVQLQAFDVRSPADFDNAFAEMVKAHVSGVVVLGEPMFTGNSRRIAELALKSHLISIHNNRIFPAAGGLLSYGPVLDELWRLAAIYIDRILKCAKPADLPVEQPTKFELVINKKTATALGIKVSDSVMARADMIIE
ncbi:MAG: ABC transporter substrate-binding protein, partial [Burkholderiales bacterium]